jgi:glycerol-3-phosphate dehydrogenase (NAD(P)+)
MKTACILGAGVMGSAMALPFATRGMDVRLVGTHLDEAAIDSMTSQSFHPKLGVTLPSQVRGFQWREFSTAADGADFILLGVSNAGVGWATDRLCESLRAPTPVIMITKGMAPETDNLAALPDAVQSEVQRRTGHAIPIAAIAGPCIAGELAVRRHTGTVIVSRDASLAQQFCAAFTTDYYHPRPSTDMIGVELCAAFKNFFAIAVGWAHGALETMPEAQKEAQNKARNNNPAAILFDQAVRELMILVEAHGGQPESVWGMPGVGDLYVTCQAGRNSRLGNHLGRGLTYAQVKAGSMKDDTIEGAETGIMCAATLRSLMTARGLELPLTKALLAVLTENRPFTPDWNSFHA